MQYKGIVNVKIKDSKGRTIFDKTNHNEGYSAMQKAFACMLAGYDTSFLKPKYINVYERRSTEDGSVIDSTNTLLKDDIQITAVNYTNGFIKKDVDGDDVNGWYAYLNALITVSNLVQGKTMRDVADGTIVLKNGTSSREVLASTQFNHDETDTDWSNLNAGLQMNVSWKLYLDVDGGET